MKFVYKCIILCIPFLMSWTLYNEQAHDIPSSYDYLLISTLHREYYIPSRYEVYVTKLCNEYDVPIWLFARLIKKESNWNSKATNINRNKTIDLGIAQLNSNYLDYFSWKFNEGKEIDPFNAKDSLRVSIKYIAHLKKSFPSWSDVVMAYNAGATRVLNNDIPTTTIEYCKTIMSYVTIKRDNERNENEGTKWF